MKEEYRIRVSVEDIIEQIVKSSNFNREQSTEFVKVLLSVIEDVLIDGDAVKIRGFGTFVPVWVKAKKVMDEILKEPTIRPGYYKVDFIPREDLSEIINEPFAHLEVVRLNVPTFEKARVDSDDNIASSGKNIDKAKVFENQALEIKELLNEIEAMDADKKSIESKADLEHISSVEVETSTQTTTEIVEDLEDNSSIETIVEKEEDLEFSNISKEENIESETADDNDIYELSDEELSEYLEFLENKKAEDNENEVFEAESNDSFSIVREVTKRFSDETKDSNSDKIVESKITVIDNLSDSSENENLSKSEANTETDTAPKTVISNDLSDSSEVESQPKSEPNTETDTASKTLISNDLSDSSEVEIYPNTEPNTETDTAPKTVISNDLSDSSEVESQPKSESNTETDTAPKTVISNDLSDNSENENLSEIEESKSDIVETDVEDSKNRRGTRIAIFSVIGVLIIGSILYFGVPLFEKYREGQKKREREIFIADSISSAMRIKQIKESFRKMQDSIDLADTLSFTDTINSKKVDDKIDSNENKIVKKVDNEPVSDYSVFEKPRKYVDYIGEEEIGAGSSLAKIAGKYYGHGAFWVYIYEANRELIKSPNNMHSGVKLKIPKLDKRLINSRDPKCIDYAKKLQSKYLK